MADFDWAGATFAVAPLAADTLALFVRALAMKLVCAYLRLVRTCVCTDFYYQHKSLSF